MSENTPPTDDLDEMAACPEPALVPPRCEDRIGHWFDGSEVHIVFPADDGQQFYCVGEYYERSHGRFLDPGHVWGRRTPPRPLAGGCRETAEPLAYHEAGHAVACLDEGIKVEYITIVPHSGRCGEARLGFCQFDHCLPRLIEQDGPTWAGRAVKATLGGPLADCLFRSRRGLDVPEDVRHAWRADHSRARKYLADEARRAGTNLELELNRLSGLLKTRFEAAWIWDAIARIAARLCDDLAICGQVARELFEQAKAAAR